MKAVGLGETGAATGVEFVVDGGLTSYVPVKI